MVRLCEQTLAARLWTVRRRLSNVARGAAEGLEGPAGTERLDPTLCSRWALSKTVVQHRSYAARASTDSLGMLCSLHDLLQALLN